jgi:hypothetical protein
MAGNRTLCQIDPIIAIDRIGRSGIQPNSRSHTTIAAGVRMGVDALDSGGRPPSFPSWEGFLVLPIIRT